MIIVHENFVPQVIQRTGASSFTRAAFGFEQSQNGADTFQPYFKFADDSITLDIDTATAGTGVACHIFNIFYFFICRYEVKVSWIRTLLLVIHHLL